MTFEVEELFTVRRDWDIVYEPGHRRTVLKHSNHTDEEVARRQIVNNNMEVGVQTLSIRRVDV